MSPNIERPLTLHTSPRDYATFNQIKSFLIFNIRLLLERAKDFHFVFSRLSKDGFQQKLANVVKNFWTLISNATDIKLFTLNQVNDEVNC